MIWTSEVAVAANKPVNAQLAPSENSRRHTLEVSFPAVDGYLRICRLNTSAFAANLGFGIDDIDDLKLAVGEAISWLLSDDSTTGTIELAFSDGSSGNVDTNRQFHFVARRSYDDKPGTLEPLGELANAILGATVDDHRFEIDDTGQAAISFEKTLVQSVDDNSA